jgi:hypothetical protein
VIGQTQNANSEAGRARRRGGFFATSCTAELVAEFILSIKKFYKTRFNNSKDNKPQIEEVICELYKIRGEFVKEWMDNIFCGSLTRK